jgi:hypothetical protein
VGKFAKLGTEKVGKILQKWENCVKKNSGHTGFNTTLTNVGG